jgi:asparagine synthase (glutamine-hydrolysing)
MAGTYGFELEHDGGGLTVCGIGVTLDTAGRGRGRPWALPLIRHRGPDDEGVRVEGDGRVALEHCRLAIIDPSNPQAAQPFVDPTGRWVLLYNGELFNFRELRADLERRGARFATESDTEVVLQAYIYDGIDACKRFRGMFAFVIYDRTSGDLVAVRDHVGVKPLYWSLRDGVFVAASEMRAMLAHPNVGRELEPAAVIEYLAFGHISRGPTLIEGVRALPPGHALAVRDGRPELIEYWDVLPVESTQPVEGIRDALFERLDAAVAAALVSDVPVSLMLSGGLDSSAIAALAARHVDPAKLTAYSVSFGLPSDESFAAARLARDLGMRHRELRLTEAELSAAFDAWVAGMDIPSANPTWIAVSHIARAVHADGFKVLLSGDGGDELFGGYDRWMTYLRFHERVWRRTPGVAKRFGGRAAGPLLGGLAGDIARRARDGGDLFVGSRPFHDDALLRHLGPVGREVAAAFPPEEGVGELRRRFDDRAPTADYLAWMSYAALKTHLVEDYLARLDKLGMQESVEGRVPLLDPELATWAFSLPQQVKVPGFRQKALFRQAVGPLLPSYITERPKQGFCPPVAAWSASLLAERLNGSSVLVEQGLVAPDAVRDLHANRSTEASFALWTLGTLMLWSEQHL